MSWQYAVPREVHPSFFQALYTVRLETDSPFLSSKATSSFLVVSSSCSIALSIASIFIFDIFGGLPHFGRGSILP